MDSTEGACIMHEYQPSAIFEPFRSSTEPADFGDGNIGALILLMRKLLTPDTTILYRLTPEGEYDQSDLCMGETTLFAYRKAEHVEDFFREIGIVVIDGAASITLEEGSLDFWGNCYGERTSYGSIVKVSVASPMGYGGNTSALESFKLLLRNAAATNTWQRLSFPKTGAHTFVVRLWDDSNGTRTDLAKVTTATWSGRYYEHFAIELL